MFSSKNIHINERKNRSKVTRYAIKKLSMGTASVAVALGFLFVQGPTVVLADTVETTQSATETTSTSHCIICLRLCLERYSPSSTN